jgi:hypothetical protein
VNGVRKNVGLEKYLIVMVTGGKEINEQIKNKAM